MSHLAWPPAVADVSVAELIEVQAVTWLRADPRMTALVNSRIYTHVPPATPFPFVRLEGFVVGPSNRLRTYGWLVSFQARASSQKNGDYEAHRIADRITQVLTDRDGPLAPCRWAHWAFESSPPSYADEVAGIVTYHRPVLVRVEVTA
jgi:Protein of unknown function (DUF3168)